MQIRSAGLWLALMIALPACAEREPIVGGRCEGCEMVFVQQPSTLSWQARIAPVGATGDAMQVNGTVFDRDRKVRPGVIVYAYQTDHTGRYPHASRDGSGNPHGDYRGWARTDEQGRFRFDTIRPARYPGTNAPEHIHLHVIEPGCATYYIDDILFSDDVALNAETRDQHFENRGGAGITTPKRTDGVWQVTRDIHLGLNIAGYPNCTAADQN